MSTTTPKSKTPTASGISRLLSAAGFTKSVRSGRMGSSSGYQVAKDYGNLYSVNGVAVRHITWSMNPAERVVSEWLGKYADAITAAGYAVNRPEARQILIVTAKEADR
jgi:hypothetical protein